MPGVLQNKNIVLAVTGSIAAYKAAFLARLLLKNGARVRVIMTPAATRFVSALSFSTLTGYPVYTQLMADDGQWHNHVELGLWADLLLIAPLTANTMAKLANGQADSVVGAVYLSAKCPVFIAPAMDLDMWKHPATQRNLNQLEMDGVSYIPVEYGALASGLTGEGRMAEPEAIFRYVVDHFIQENTLQGKKILLTAGPTREALDPVRFLSNHSTGTMGIEIAKALARKGAEVHLVLGPVGEKNGLEGIKVYPVISAQDMYGICVELFPSMDAAIMAAAVADYTPKNYSEAKIKKQGDDLNIPLRRTKDIAAALGQIKKEGQYLIGFALETDDEKANARKKLHKKNLDLIVLNSLRDEGAGFGTQTNKVTLVYPDDTMVSLPLKPKAQLAEDITRTLIELANWEMLIK